MGGTLFRLCAVSDSDRCLPRGVVKRIWYWLVLPGICLLHMTLKHQNRLTLQASWVLIWA